MLMKRLTYDEQLFRVFDEKDKGWSKEASKGWHLEGLEGWDLNIYLYHVDQEWGVQEVFTGLYTRDQHTWTKEIRAKKWKRKNTMEYDGNGEYWLIWEN